MSRSLRALVVGLVLVPALPARAEFPLKLSASTGAQVFTARAFDFVGEADHAATLRVAAGWGFAMPLGALELDLGYASASTSAELHGSAAEADLWLRGLELGATYRLALGRVLHPFARLGVLYNWATLSLDSPALEQRVGHYGVSALAGVSVPLIAARRGPEDLWYPWLSLDLGLGYVWRPDYDFDALAGEPRAGIRVAPLNVGKMPLSGWDYRVSVSARF